MKVLISSIACEPGMGSEAKVGWDAVAAISRGHNCHVITHAVYRNAIDKAQAEGALPNVSFHYHGRSYRWHPSRLIARMQSWLIYHRWQSELLGVATNLHRRYSFDLAHHVTYATWRVSSPLWKLPIPFVWGPIGGTSTMPRNFRCILSPCARAFELARDASTATASRAPTFLRCVQRSAVVVAANEETEIFLRRFRPQGAMERFPVAYFSADQKRELFRTPQIQEPRGPLRLFAGGNLIGSKGLSLALEGLALARQRDLAFDYTIAGGGPELAKLQALVEELNLADVVHFHDGYRGDAYHAKLKSTDVYLMPSFRDTTPITLLEAILAGCYPIVAGTSAAGEIVDQVGGCCVSVESPDATARDICEALLWCDRERSSMKKVAAEAAAKVALSFSEDAYIQAVGRAFQRAKQTSPPRAHAG